MAAHLLTLPVKRKKREQAGRERAERAARERGEQSEREWGIERKRPRAARFFFPSCRSSLVLSALHSFSLPFFFFFLKPTKRCPHSPRPRAPPSRHSESKIERLNSYARARQRERGRERGRERENRKINDTQANREKKNSISLIASLVHLSPTNSSVRAVRPRVAMAVRASVSTQQVRVKWGKKPRRPREF